MGLVLCAFGPWKDGKAQSPRQGAGNNPRGAVSSASRALSSCSLLSALCLAPCAFRSYGKRKATRQKADDSRDADHRVAGTAAEATGVSDGFAAGGSAA